MLAQVLVEKRYVSCADYLFHQVQEELYKLKSMNPFESNRDRYNHLRKYICKANLLGV